MNHHEARTLPQRFAQVRMLPAAVGVAGPGVLEGYFAVWGRGRCNGARPTSYLTTSIERSVR